MKTIRTFADRAAMPAMGALTLLNALFFAVFVATLVMLAAPARAEQMPVCGGKDITTTMDPAELAKIRAEADKTPNGKNLLWKIEKPGAAPSWLFGTMHLTDPRVIDLTKPAKAAFASADTVVIETTDVLDETKTAAEMMKNPSLMMFTDGTTLSALLDDKDRKLVEDALAKRGIPLMAVNLMRPWVISSMVSLPACELARKKAKSPFLDIKLAADAKAQGKALGGLETMQDQLDAMNSLPVELHVRGLVDTLALGDRLDDMIETMLVLYTKGDVGMIWPLLNAVAPKTGNTDDHGYAEFEKIMVTARNHGMAENARPFLDKGHAFIAVGALHLPGEEGVVELLRKDGYTVTPEG